MISHDAVRLATDRPIAGPLLVHHRDICDVFADVKLVLTAT